MIILEKPVINSKKGHSFENIEEKNREATKQIHKDLQEIKDNSLVVKLLSLFLELNFK